MLLQGKVIFLTGGSTGIGLENLRRRLARYFPDAHAFAIGQEGDFVVARLTLAGRGSTPNI